MPRQYDLIIRAGRIFCSASNLDTSGAVAVSAGCIAAVGADISGSAGRVFDFPDCVLLPGLVDLHAHPDTTGSRFGVDADKSLLPFGTTTALSQGDAGAANWKVWEEEAERKACRLMMALNLGARGEATSEGCFFDESLADVSRCVDLVNAAGSRIWGIAVNTSIPSCGRSDPREILRRGLAAAELTGKPILFGSRRAPDWPLAQQLSLLRPGDVVTYCFSPDPDGILSGDHIRDEVWQARQRGVLFDLGHGMGSFSYRVAEAAIAQGFYPDTISTDLYRLHLRQPTRHDLPRTLSKLINIGMPEGEAFSRVTDRPARILGLAPIIGELTSGSCADLTVMRWTSTSEPLVDTRGETRAGGSWETVATFRAGALVLPPVRSCD